MCGGTSIGLAQNSQGRTPGTGDLDPLEVVETLPQAMMDAFESRNVDQLREALAQMDPKEAEYYMKRRSC